MMDYSIVIPVYNEQEVLKETCHRLLRVMGAVDGSYELVFVDDGSRDASAVIIEELCRQNPAVKLISFNRNFGHQAAISAGLDYAAGRAIVIIDADLQDPPEVIPQMIEKWKAGFDVVYGRRMERKGETLFKKFSASAFYRVFQCMTDHSMPLDAGDFRLIDRKVCDVLKKMPEKNRYLRGLISWIGYRQGEVEYVREERWAGVTKYSLRKMLKLSLDAITSFSYKPLKFVSYIGAGLMLVSLLLSCLVIFITIEGVTLWMLFNLFKTPAKCRVE